MRVILFFFIVLSVVLSGCASKHMLKDAQLYETNNMYEEAYQTYSQHFFRYYKAESKVGMVRVAKAIINREVQKATMDCARENYQAALDQYENVFRMISSEYSAVVIETADIQRQYAECKSNYLNRLCEEAEELLKTDRFGEAQERIDRIKRLDFKNVKAEYLQMMAIILPNYKSGVVAMDLGLWRDAYYYFLEVTKVDADFADALNLREICRKNAEFTMAYVTSQNNTQRKDVTSSLAANIKSTILELDDPFIRLVERDNLEQLLAEQKHGMTGLFDEETAIEAGKLTGAQYILTGELVSYTFTTGRPTVKEKKGFLGNDIRDKHIKYFEYSTYSEIVASFRYHIMNAETGVVVKTGVVPFQMKDQAEWAEFTGDHSLVYPGEWKWQLINSQEDYVQVEQREQLQELFEAPQTVASELALQTFFYEFVSDKVAAAVKDFTPDKK